MSRFSAPTSGRHGPLTFFNLPLMLIASLLFFTLQYANAAPSSSSNGVALNVKSKPLVSRAESLGPILGTWESGTTTAVPDIEIKADGTVVTPAGAYVCPIPDGAPIASGLTRRVGEGESWSGNLAICSDPGRQSLGTTRATWILYTNGQDLFLDVPLGLETARFRPLGGTWSRPSPTGVLERCDATYCYGWVKQPGNPNPIKVDLSLLGTGGNTETVANSGTASEARGDGSFGFKIEHKQGPGATITAGAINTVLEGSPKTVEIPDPTGALERCDETYCYGWVKQAGFNGPIDVHLYVDGSYGTGTMKNTGTASSENRGDGSHSFKIAHKLAIDDWNKQIYVHAIGKDPNGNGNGKNPVLPGSPKTVELPNPSGALVSCTSKTATTGVCTGWARQDGYTGSIDVHLYAGGSFGMGGSQKVGAGTANLPSEGNGPHGFEITYTLLESSPTPTTIYAHAIGRRRNGNLNGKNPVLDGSPKTIAPEDRPASGKILRCDDTYCYGWAVTGSGGQTFVRLYADKTRNDPGAAPFVDARADQDGQTLIAAVEGLTGVVDGPPGQRWFKLPHNLNDGNDHMIYGYVRGLDPEGNDYNPQRNPEMDGSPFAFTASKSFNYVHMGDSYAAGPGVGDYGDSGKCFRSKNSWGELYARTTPPSGRKVIFKNRSCSGAVILDVIGKQLGDLKPETDLITLSIGGNDIGFVDIIKGCRFDNECKQATDRALGNIDNVLELRLKALLDQLQSKTDGKAKVMITGYPIPYNSGTDCDDGLVPGLSTDDRKLINNVATKLNAGIRTAISKFATEQDVDYRFIDVSPQFQDHRLCDVSDRWLNLPYDITRLQSGTAGLWHPSPAGHYAYLRALPKLDTMGSGPDTSIASVAEKH